MSRSIQLAVASVGYFLSVNIYHYRLSRDRELELENEKFVIELNVIKTGQEDWSNSLEYLYP